MVRHLDPGRQLRQNRFGGSHRCDAAAFHDQRAVGEIAVAVGTRPIARVREETQDLAAVYGRARGVSGPVRAPCRIQSSSWVRSASVMHVRLPVGIARVATCGSIARKFARSPADESSSRPLGAVANPGCVGAAA